jgi:hypothetical protein
MGKRWLSGRRKGDGPGYVDLYHPLLFLILVGIISLSLADAYLTLEAIAAGGKELNPAMHLALDLGQGAFIAIKLAVTGLGVVLLCMHKNFPRVRWIILAVLVGYLLLIAYHFYLMR